MPKIQTLQENQHLDSLVLDLHSGTQLTMLLMCYLNSPFDVHRVHVKRPRGTEHLVILNIWGLASNISKLLLA